MLETLAQEPQPALQALGLDGVDDEKGVVLTYTVTPKTLSIFASNTVCTV